MDEIVIADSDVIIDYFNGVNPSADVVAALIAGRSLGLTAVSVFELFAGVVGKKRLKAVELLLSQATIVPLDAKAGITAAGVYTELKKKGQLIGNQDTLIAGICIANGLPLFTRNRSHFEKIPGLDLYVPIQI